MAGAAALSYGFYGSPYASPAAFALSPLLIDPDTLKNDGFVSEDDLARSVYYGSPYTADYEFAAKAAGSF